MLALKWQTPAEVYAAPHRPEWWDAWVAHLAGISADPYDSRRETEVWRWYETLWLQEPRILEEIGTRAARGVAGQCEEAKVRGYASVSVWRLAVAEEARLEEERQREARKAADAAYRAQQRNELKRWRAEYRARMVEGAAEKRARLEPHMVWGAYLYGARKLGYAAIGEEIGTAPSAVNGLIRRFVEACIPEAIRAPYSESDPYEIPNRRRVVRDYFGRTGEPPRAVLVPPPAAEMAEVGRNRWIWLERRRGRSYRELAEATGLSGTRCQQIDAKQCRLEAERERRERLAASIARTAWHAARRNLGRPLDLGGPRDRWLVYEPWTPEGAVSEVP